MAMYSMVCQNKEVTNVNFKKLFSNANNFLAGISFILAEMEEGAEWVIPVATAYIGRNWRPVVPADQQNLIP